MATTLDVLVIESVPGAADETSAALERAGHRLHRCYDADERAFPCTGVRDPASCPIEQGVDVALLVRPHIAPRPTALEAGVRCTIRARVPLVEQGSEALDPFAPWVTARVAGDAVDACSSALDRALERALDPLLARVRRQVAQTMTALAPSRGPVTCAVRRNGQGLHVELSGPRLGKETENALAVSVADAVRAEGRPHTTLDVSYHATARG